MNLDPDPSTLIPTDDNSSNTELHIWGRVPTGDLIQVGFRIKIGNARAYCVMSRAELLPHFQTKLCGSMAYQSRYFEK